MFCPKCGRETPDENTTYCLGCGLNLGRLDYPTDEEVQTLKTDAMRMRAPAYAQTDPYAQPAQAPASAQAAQTPPYAQPAQAPSSAQATQTPPYVQPAQPAQQAQAEPETKKKKGNVLVIILAAVLGLLVVGAIAAVIIATALGGRSTHIPLNDYVTVSFEGYDGSGTANALFDSERFLADYGGKIKLTGKGKRAIEAGDDLKELADLSLLAEADAEPVAVFPLLFENSTVEPSEGLKNGDEVVVKWNLSGEAKENLKEYLRCTVDTADKTYVASGLDAVAPVDLFAGMTLSFSGAAPNGYAEIDTLPDVEYANELQYEIQPQDGLSNGDTVTVKVTANGADPDPYLSDHYGVRAAEKEKTFTVEGLNQPAESWDDISDDAKRRMESTAQGLIGDYFASEQDTLSYTKADNIGALFLTAADPEQAYDGQNMVILVYRAFARVTVREEPYDYVGDATYYTWVSFRDITMTEMGGSDVDTDTAMFSGNTFFYEIPETATEELPALGHDLRGYETLDALLSDIQAMYGGDYDIDERVDDSGTTGPGGADGDDAAQDNAAQDNAAQDDTNDATANDGASDGSGTDEMTNGNPDAGNPEEGENGDADAGDGGTDG